MKAAVLLLFLSSLLSLAGENGSRHPDHPALVFLIAGQSNAGGVAAFSPKTNEKSGMARKHPTIPGSTAKEVGIPTTKDAYPRSFIWGRNGFDRLAPGKNLKGGYNDPNRHGIELPMAMLLEKGHPDADKFFIKHGPGGHNLHTQWKAGSGPDYKTFKAQLDGAMADLNKRYDKVKIIGLYWDQGESDRPKAQEYGKNLRALFAAFRKDSGVPDLPIFVRKHLFQHRDESFVPILEAQVEVTGEDPAAHLLDLDLGSNAKNFKAWAWTDNNGHLSSKAYLELAGRILNDRMPEQAPVTARQANPFGEIGKADKNSALNMHLCPEGEFEVGKDQWGEIVRVNMLKIDDWSKVPGVKKAWVMRGFEGEEGMAFHPIISEVKDVDGDGKPDIFRCRSEHEDARIERLRYDDGSVVWESAPMAALHGDESRLPVFDLDGDGVCSVLHATKGGTWCVNARTGDIKMKIDYRQAGLRNAQNMAVGDFDPASKGLEIAICGKGGNLLVCDSTGKKLWNRNVPSSLLSKGDWDGNGVEDITCFALGANVDGMFSVWNGKGERLYAISFLPSPSKRTWSIEHNGGSWSHAMPGGHEGIRRQLDLDGNGRADFIMPFGAWHWGSDAILFLMEGE